MLQNFCYLNLSAMLLSRHTSVRRGSPVGTPWHGLIHALGVAGLDIRLGLGLGRQQGLRHVCDRRREAMVREMGGVDEKRWLGLHPDLRKGAAEIGELGGPRHVLEGCGRSLGRLLAGCPIGFRALIGLLGHG